MRYYTIGNEPNLNGFWLPQFGPNGENVAAPAYLELLAEAYDALKAVSTNIVVLGGALSPRGSDNPALSRHTHSPTQFILDMGAAYKASGRTKPVMDALSINPFPDNSSQSPATPHPNTSIGVADYDKLVKLLGQAFDGTAQPGSTLPIYYGEFGVESLPTAAKASLYTGEEPTTTKPVDEKTQAAYYRKAVELAVLPAERRRDLHVPRRRRRAPARLAVGLLLRGQDGEDVARRDEAGRPRQSRGGIVAKCAGYKLTPTVDRFGPFGSNGRYGVNFRCNVDCTADIQLVRDSDKKVVGKLTGRRRSRASTRSSACRS